MTIRRRSTSLLFHTQLDGASRDSVLRPPTDLCRTANGWLVKMELAGVKPDDIAIDIDGTSLHIHGARRDYTCDEVTAHHNLEIAYQRFLRTITLPHPVDASQISLDFRDGMLLLRVQLSKENS
ncbi:MAG: Hsp20/alpha crystallin family protein [Bryobacterales bacterium]|jgi:HSP20 family protein|nr:Hsp20/alpha crystallin family protein [Bryobacterales bacterium]